ncbi:hypothetical protein EV356DRAFT_578641 [Viridothelium virens]|uniref:Uncharacterized protein n=1 Tax=Viridothelium virens TaxID=1048519 RepID=A0A6A6H1U7_VIRVR|nr:hypothetical protein EV356DRAFT_578641 [Viridothelium virens]
MSAPYIISNTGAPVKGAKSSSIVVDENTSYGLSQSSKYEEHSKDGNSVFKSVEDGSRQKDKNVDVAIHNEKRESGYKYNLHEHNHGDIDFDGSFWDKSRDGTRKADVNFHGDKWDDKNVKGFKDESNGKEKAAFQLDEKHSNRTHLDVFKTTQGSPRPPPPPSSGPRGSKFSEKLRNAAASLKGKKLPHKRERGDVKFHKDEHIHDDKHDVVEGAKTGAHPPKGWKPYSEVKDGHYDAQHLDETHIKFDGVKGLPPKPTLLRRDTTSEKSTLNEQNFAEEHVHAVTEEDKAAKTKDLKVDKSKEAWGQKDFHFDGKKIFGRLLRIWQS